MTGVMLGFTHQAMSKHISNCAQLGAASLRNPSGVKVSIEAIKYRYVAHVCRDLIR